jgi:hypothetical protein
VSPGARRRLDRLHRPPEPEPHHLQQHVGLVALGGDGQRGAEPDQGAVDLLARVRRGGEQHPRTPRGGCPDRRAGWRHHRQRLAEHRSDVDPHHRRARLDAHREVEVTGSQRVEQRRRGRHREDEVDVGSIGTEGTHHTRVVDHGRHVDHPQPNRAGTSRTQSVRPRHEITGERHHMAGVVEHRRSRRPQHPPTAVRFEQLDAEPALELGETLRQRRRAHAHLGRRDRPRGGVGDRHQVLQLTDRDVGQDAVWHPAHNSSVLLH